MAYRELSKKTISLKEATYFHGHLGPYLIFGLKAGELALELLKAKKYFGIEVRVFGLDKKPKSCIIDGLQLSTGATFGKGNIVKITSPLEKLEFIHSDTGRKLRLTIKENLLDKLREKKDHKACESLAREIFHTKPELLFNISK